MKLNYYRELDGVRAIAALMVMVFHFFGLSYVHNAYPTIAKFSVFGQTGVSLFFVLSGFLITRILLSTKNSPNYFYNFYIRRALRIFPLYYLVLIIYYFVLPLIFQSPSVPFNQQVYHWLYLQNFAKTFEWSYQGPGHFWSLAVEEHFYMFWPFTIFFLNNKKIIASCIAIVVFAILCRVILVSNNYEVFYFTFCRMDELAIGALLAFFELRNKLVAKNANKFLLLGIAILIPTITVWTFFTGSHNPILQVIKYLLLSFTYFSIVGYVVSVRESHPVKKLLGLKPLIFSGKISYGLYVFHPLVYVNVSKFIKTSNIAFDFVIMFTLTYLVASASFYFFEERFLKLKRFFKYPGEMKGFAVQTLHNPPSYIEAGKD
jgi:Predicted acyltransferases